jgi:hypothetical protein
VNSGEFMKEVRERSDGARDHVKAVMTALKDAVTDEGFEEVMGQRDREYRALAAA